MPQDCCTAPKRRKGRWALVVIPGVAFALGLGAAIGAAKTRGEPFRGVCRQEAVAVVAVRSGKLLSIDAAHGTEVVPGRRLAMIEDAGVAARVASLTNERDRLARELDVATRKASAELTLRVASLEKDRLETRLRYADLLRARLDVQVRRKALEQGGEIGPVAGGRTAVWPVSAQSSAVERRLNLADALNHEEVLGTQVALCEDRLAELERSIAELPAQLDRAFEVDRLRSDLAAVEGRLKEAEQAETGAEIVSPAHGRVGVYRKKPGDAVVAGETVVQVFDAERTFVLLTVGLKEAARLAPGTRVGVEFEGVETKKPLFGTVAEVASEAEIEADAATTPGTLSARVRIAPAGRLWPVVPPGTTALVRAAG